MDSISGARAAGAHVGAHTRLIGIHHTDQVSSASSPCSTLTQPLQMLLAHSPVTPQAKVSTVAYTYTFLKKLIEIQEDAKTRPEKTGADVFILQNVVLDENNCVIQVKCQMKLNCLLEKDHSRFTGHLEPDSNPHI